MREYIVDESIIYLLENMLRTIEASDKCHAT